MARARNIKPSFFDNDNLALQNDPLGRLLFIGLWTLADCHGNLEWRSHRIKVKLLPYDNCDVEKLAINLDKSGFIRFYSDGDKILLNIPNFTVHQNPHKNEREKGASVVEYSDDLRQLIDITTLTINRDKSGSKPESSHSDPADSLLLNPESPILNPESGNLNPETGGGSGEPCQAEILPDDVMQVFQHWQSRMNHPKAKLDDKRKKKIRGAMKLGYSPDDLKQAIDGCASSSFHMGQNDRQMVYDGLDLIFRDADHIDKFIKLQQMPAGPGQQEPEWLDGWLSGGGNAGH